MCGYGRPRSDEGNDAVVLGVAAADGLAVEGVDGDGMAVGSGAHLDGEQSMGGRAVEGSD